MTLSKQATMLKNISLFSCLEDTQLEALARLAKSRRFPKNATIINEGDDSKALYVVNKGSVKVTKVHEDGREVVMAVLSEGDYFGEMALIDDQPRSASVVTKQPCEFYVFTKGDFNQALLDNPSLSTSMMQGLCSRLRAANRNIESLALMDVYGRVARLLLDLARPQDGRLIIQEPLTHKEIANRVGSSREMVSRILKDLTLGNYISVDRKLITINSKLPPSW